jgi:hypothetical protein
LICAASLAAPLEGTNYRGGKTMRARPDENSRFARRFKPRAHHETSEAVDYFTAFALASPDSGASGSLECVRNETPAEPAALEMIRGNLC